MTSPADYNAERENNIIKNIAKEIVLECIQSGLEVPQELANYLVKLKLLNPKNGFTASEVMPRSLTQELVSSVVEDLKQDTPAMNCLKMQVYWNSINLNVAELKKEYASLMTDKAEQYLIDLLSLEREDASKLPKLMANYILVVQNLGNLSSPIHIKETIAAFHSIFKNKDISTFFVISEDSKIEVIKKVAKKITGIRLFLKMIGRAGDGIEDVKTLTSLIESYKEDVSELIVTITRRIDEIREVISSVLPMHNIMEKIVQPAEVVLPPECDASDLKYLKQILVIMLQHNVYLSDIASKFEEIDGNANFYLKEYDEVLMRLNGTIRDRDAVPTSEVYDDFARAGELWVEIQSYFFCVESVESVAKNLKEINKREHFNQTFLEKSVNLPSKNQEGAQNQAPAEGTKALVPSSVLLLEESEDFNLEFRGFCAWTLYFGDGFLLPGNPNVGVFQYHDQYYSFSTKIGHKLWSMDPHFYLMEIYQILRVNPEMVELLNVYENLYNTKSLQLVKKVDRKISTRTQDTQTLLHPVEHNWKKNYTFSEWELKKQALALARISRCVTKSAQTVNHSHYRASIGLLAAPDKDQQTQTKVDKANVHPTIASYLYGLRGHKENKFKILTLTRPNDEILSKEIISEKFECSNPKKEILKVATSTQTCSSHEASNKFILIDFVNNANE